MKSEERLGNPPRLEDTTEMAIKRTHDPGMDYEPE